MPDWATLYPSRFLKKEKLEAPKLIRIEAVNQPELENEKGQKEIVIALKYRDANGTGEISWCKSNALLTGEAVGTRDYAEWTGKYILIYHEPLVRYAGKAVGGIRVAGSPHLAETKEVMIKMPRSKREEYYLLVPTAKNGSFRAEFPWEPMTLNKPHAADMPVFDDTTEIVNGEVVQ